MLEELIREQMEYEEEYVEEYDDYGDIEICYDMY